MNKIAISIDWKVYTFNILNVLFVLCQHNYIMLVSHYISFVNLIKKYKNKNQCASIVS